MGLSSDADSTNDPLAQQPEATVDPQTIIDKWNARLSAQSGHGSFLRHLDGNVMNTEKENLECVHPFDAFAAMHHGLNWVVDWGTGLTDAERQFVRDNLWNFCAAYQDWGDDTERHDFELTALEEQVLSLSEQGDAALEAGDAVAAMDFYQKAKDVRANALFGSKEDFLKGHQGTGGADSGDGAGSKSPTPLFGRRSNSKATFTETKRQSIITSTPSRRHAPEGKPTKREEVQARIAARDAAPR